MTPAELAALDATDQADLVRRKEVAPADLVGAAIAAAEALNPGLNAIVHERFERAAGEAATAGGSAAEPRRLAGVPLVVKDLDGYLAGEPYHAGTRHLREVGYVPAETSLLFQRLVDAGAVIIGKTNTPELGLVPSTEPAAYGATRNPWDPERSPAGSSGGSAAAVAAGIVAIGHAGDGGGSIRLPAAVCGLVGLKPSRGLVPTHPDVEPWGGLVSRLALTRTVRDTALVLDVLSGPDPLGSPRPEAPARPFVAEVGADPGRLRIGLLVEAPDGSPVDPACAEGARRVAAMLSGLGHHVEEIEAADIADPATHEERVSAFMAAFSVWTRSTLDQLGDACGVPFTADGVEPHTWALAQGADAIPAAAFVTALDRLHGIGRHIRSWWAQGWDVLVTPTSGERPWRLGQFASTSEDPVGPLVRATPIVAFTVPFNISGQPAISLPLHEVDGLPVGVQFVAAWGRDDVLLRVAAQLEAVAPWASRRPRLHAGVA